MVPVATASASSACSGSRSVTVKVSSCSSTRSAAIGTLTVRLSGSPGRNVTLPSHAV